MWLISVVLLRWSLLIQRRSHNALHVSNSDLIICFLGKAKATASNYCFRITLIEPSHQQSVFRTLYNSRPTTHALQLNKV